MIMQILIIATDAGKMLGIRVDKSSTLRKTLSSTALFIIHVHGLQRCQAMACFLNVSCRQTGGACFRFANGSDDIYEEQRSRWLKAPEKVTSAVPFVFELGDLKVLMCQQRNVLYHDPPHDLPPPLGTDIPVCII